jgi:hypothetical protein
MKQIYLLVLPLFSITGSVSAQMLAQNYTASNSLTNNSVRTAEPQVMHSPERQLMHSPERQAMKSPEGDVARPTERQAWLKEEDLVDGRIASNKLMRMKAVTETIVGFFQDSIIIEGEFSPEWHGEYFPDGQNTGKDMKFNIQCNFTNQKASLAILANTIRPLQMEPLVVNNQEFQTMRPITGGDKDHPCFEYSGDGADANSGNGNGASADGGALKFRFWLVATGGKLPYIPVSRAEYLAAARMELVATENVIIADLKRNLPLRDASVQEADKKAALDQIATLYSGMDLQLRTRMFLNGYKTDEEYQQETIDKRTADLQGTIDLMDHLLHHLSPAALAKPAIVSVQAAAFNGFEDGQGGRMLVRINPAFETAAAGAAHANAPRCLLVQWQYDPSESMAMGIDRQLQERFDGEKLKAIL